jgi:fructoselysine-6-P-deglycase FrlB-like protein
MDLVVKARDPKDGAAVLVICPSGREALATLEHLRQERLKIIGITDRQGTVVSESDLATDPWSLRLFRAVPRFQPRGGKG